MNKNTIEQEQLCLEVKCLCDLLRTKLFMIDNFNDFDFYSKQLKNIKSKVDKIYWEL